jgi:hypothetical protein
MKLQWVRNEIARMRGQMRAQEREIQMLQRAGVATASAELLLVRMRAKVEDLCRERDTLRTTAGRPDQALNSPECANTGRAAAGRGTRRSEH